MTTDKGHESIDKFSNTVEGVGLHVSSLDKRELHGLVDTAKQKYHQVNSLPPIPMYFICTFFFILSALCFSTGRYFDEIIPNIIFFGFPVIMMVLLYVCPIVLALYMKFGWEEETVYVVCLTESDVNFTTKNGHTVFSKKLIFRTSDDEYFCFEFGGRSPKREFKEGEEIQIKVHGMFYKPVEKLYR